MDSSPPTSLGVFSSATSEAKGFPQERDTKSKPRHKSLPPLPPILEISCSITRQQRAPEHIKAPLWGPCGALGTMEEGRGGTSQRGNACISLPKPGEQIYPRAVLGQEGQHYAKQPPSSCLEDKVPPRSHPGQRLGLRPKLHVLLLQVTAPAEGLKFWGFCRQRCAQAETTSSSPLEKPSKAATSVRQHRITSSQNRSQPRALLTAAPWLKPAAWQAANLLLRTSAGPGRCPSTLAAEQGSSPSPVTSLPQYSDPLSKAAGTQNQLSRAFSVKIALSVDELFCTTCLSLRARSGSSPPFLQRAGHKHLEPRTIRWYQEQPPYTSAGTPRPSCLLPTGTSVQAPCREIGPGPQKGNSSPASRVERSAHPSPLLPDWKRVTADKPLRHFPASGSGRWFHARSGHGSQLPAGDTAGGAQGGTAPSCRSSDGANRDRAPQRTSRQGRRGRRAQGVPEAKELLRNSA